MIIRNGQVVLPGREEPEALDIRIRDGKIVELGPGLSGDEEVVEARGMLVLPGGIDPHVHFDDPGFTDREDFAAGSRFAASGGITTVIDMPCTSIPPVTTVANLEEKLKAVEKKAVIDYGFYGGVCCQSMGEGYPDNFLRLAEIVFGFKVYYISVMELFSAINTFQFRLILQRAAELGVTVLLHAEDFSYVSAATEYYLARGDTPVYYYNSRPEMAEILAVRSALELAEEAGADLHLVHLSTGKAARLAAAASATCETCPHLLEFNLDDFIRLGSPLKTTPPVKRAGNREELWDLLASGGIDFVASDHATCPAEGKNTGSVWTDYAGIPGTGTLLPYLFSEGYLKGRFSLKRLVEVTSENAARRYGLYPDKGAIETGTDGDLVLIDPGQSWKVTGADFLSRGHITPFEGREFKGRVMETIVRGRTVYRAGAGILAEGGYGRFLTRG